MEDENMQMGYMQVQILQQQATQLEQQLRMIEQRLEEVSMTSKTIDDLENTKEKEMVIPLGSGLMLEVERKSLKNVIVNVGAKTTVGMDIPLARKKLEEMQKNIEGFRVQISGQLDDLHKAIDQVINQMNTSTPNKTKKK